MHHNPLFFVLINGVLWVSLNNKRLRQGDPISSFFFILVIDVLSRLFPKAEGDEDIKGIQVSTGCPRFSCFLSVDDLVIFVREKEEAIFAIMHYYDQFQA